MRSLVICCLLLASCGDDDDTGPPPADSPNVDSPAADSPAADSPAADSPAADSPTADGGAMDTAPGDTVAADAPPPPVDAPAPAWALNLGSPGLDVAVVEAGPDGDFVVAGNRAGNIDFGAGFVAGTGIFVARYTAAGGFVWAQTFETDQSELGDVAVDGAGDVLVSGGFTHPIVFSSTLTLDHSGSSQDAFVAKLAGADGAPLWAVAAGQTGEEKGAAVAADGTEVLLALRISGNVDLGEGAYDTLLSDVGVIRYSAAGAYLDSMHVGGTGNEVVGSMAIDPASGAIFLAGTWSVATDLGLGEVLSSTGSDEAFVVSYLPDFTPQWQQLESSPAENVPSRLALDSSGAPIYAMVVGPTLTPVMEVRRATGGTTADVETLATFLGPVGFTPMWSVSGLAVGPDDTIAVCGDFLQEIDLGAGPIASVMDSHDGWVADLHPTGPLHWGTALGWVNFETCVSVAVLTDGTVVPSGRFVDITMIGSFTFPNAGGADIWLAGLPP